MASSNDPTRSTGDHAPGDMHQDISDNAASGTTNASAGEPAPR